MRLFPSPAREALDLEWLNGRMPDAEYVKASKALDAAEEELREALLWRNRAKTVWRGFVIGLASPLTWLIGRN